MTEERSDTDRPEQRRAVEPEDAAEPARPLRQQHPVARGFWLVLGLGFVALGIIGALLPLMPTTIFLILAVGCFARSSTRLESWLLDHPRFGPTLRAWRRDGAISKRGKAAACAGMALGYGFFWITARPHLHSALIVAIVLGGCAAFVLTRPTAGDGLA